MTLAQSEPKIVYKIAPEAQAIFFRRRHHPSRPPLAKIRLGRPAPAMGTRNGSPMRYLKQKRADRRGRPARSGDELTTTASCQGEKATACQDQRRRVKAIRLS